MEIKSCFHVRPEIKSTNFDAVPHVAVDYQKMDFQKPAFAANCSSYSTVTKPTGAKYKEDGHHKGIAFENRGLCNAELLISYV